MKTMPVCGSLRWRDRVPGAWDWNLETGDQVHSRRWQEMLGYEYGEIVARNRSFVERIHPEDRERVERSFNQYLEGKTASYSTELRLRCKDGTWKWILTSGMVVRRSADGKPLRMIGTHVDIQERKAAEALLQQSEERWKLAMESTGDGILGLAYPRRTGVLLQATGRDVWLHGRRAPSAPGRLG